MTKPSHSRRCTHAYICTHTKNIAQITKMTKYHPILTNLSDCCLFILALFLLLCRCDLLIYQSLHCARFLISWQHPIQNQASIPWPPPQITQHKLRSSNKSFLLITSSYWEAPWFPTVYVFPQNIEQQTQIQIHSWWSLLNLWENLSSQIPR